jgi:hypothetical protein
LPFEPIGVWAISPHGVIVSGFPERYAFEIIRPGQPVVSIRREIRPDPVSATERKEAKDRVETMMRRTDPKWNWNGPDIPGTKPFFTGISVGQDGRIWVARNSAQSGAAFSTSERNSTGSAGGGGRTLPPASTTRGRSTVPATPVLFDIFEPNGTYVGQVRVPARTTLFARRGDHAWGVVFDEDDVATVKRFRLVWR